MPHKQPKVCSECQFESSRFMTVDYTPHAPGCSKDKKATMTDIKQPTQGGAGGNGIRAHNVEGCQCMDCSCNEPTKETGGTPDEFFNKILTK